MRVLVACEFSGAVRDAFARLGHDAWSCDLLPTETAGQHLQCDVRAVNLRDFDIVIAHPPCTHLAVSGARWWNQRKSQQAEAINFVQWIRDNAPAKCAIENPIGILSTTWRKPDQIIQPWQHGHGETKATCLWLSGLPPLKPSNIVNGREARVHRESPGPDRWARRSRTLPGIARAMAEQWGSNDSAREVGDSSGALAAVNAALDSSVPAASAIPVTHLRVTQESHAQD